MKKIDLHIHTKKTQWDAEFVFSLNVLDEYVKKLEIDCIAITNHNCFDAVQFNLIAKTLNIEVLPGIEITLGSNHGHMILISNSSEVEDFACKCQKVEEYFCHKGESLDITTLKQIFCSLSSYLLIPHYDKAPTIDRNILLELSDYITAGEVGSVKKFSSKYKDGDSYVPLLFSDLRAKENLDSYPSRQTFVDLDEININSLKLCLSDRTKVSLSRGAGHQFFQALPDGLVISTGLNVILGGRSSGKSYTLDEISKSHERVKYIRQFELLEKDPEKDEETFNDRLKSSQAKITDEFLNDFKMVVDDVSDICIEKDEKNIETYINSLLTFASETEKSDTFSKCKLFSEPLYQDEKLNNLEKLIDAVEVIIDSQEYRSIIEKHIVKTELIALHRSLIDRFIKDQQLILKHRCVNSIVVSIKNGLQSKTAAPRVDDVNLFDIQRNRMKVKQFERISKNIVKEREIHKSELQNFKIVGKLLPYGGAQEMQRHSRTKLAFSVAFSQYDTPYKFLEELKNIQGINSSTYYQYFAKADFKILNQYGFPVSGGERAEFNLLREINDALQYDMLLIDEPESSFDNLFLKDQVNALIKDIAKYMPVVLVTHNNTVGISIQPDYLLFTKREIDKSGVHFRLYSGYPSSRTLSDLHGNTIENHLVLLDCLEAGSDAYKERSKQYEMLNH